MNRCPSCGMLLSTPHLKNCKMMRRKGGALYNTPTPKMLDFANNLAMQLGKAIPTDMTFDQCSDLIDSMKEEINNE